jgi:glycosyltransferase involved in cell wall biosynthesis
MNVQHLQPVPGVPINVMLVDPSLFTGPYDAALTAGLLASSVQPLWATRPTRSGDCQEIPVEYVDSFFYRRTDQLVAVPRLLRSIVKGIAHFMGLCKLMSRVVRRRPDVVHFQWTVVPALDTLAIGLIRFICPVVLTVHDTVPFNGERMSLLQNVGFDLPLRLVDRIIVHTQTGHNTLVKRGLSAKKIAVIPHGPLRLRATPIATTAPRDPRWTFLLFGEIKPYKGIDVLIDALAQLTPLHCAQARVIIAGRPRMDLSSTQTRIATLDLNSVIELRLRRHSEQEMADLFAETDCFLFPYHKIDASGVYFLVKPLGKWMIASRVGIFAEDMQQPGDGMLVPGGNSAALAFAITNAITQRPSGTPGNHHNSWSSIGQLTRACYLSAINQSSPVPQSTSENTSPIEPVIEHIR